MPEGNTLIPVVKICKKNKDRLKWTVLGYLDLGPNPFIGESITVYTGPGLLKEEYGKKYEEITLPVVCRHKEISKVQVMVWICADASKKSLKQISLMGLYPREKKEDLE